MLRRSGPRRRPAVGEGRGRAWSRGWTWPCRTRTRALVINQFLEIYKGTGLAAQGLGPEPRSPSSSTTACRRRSPRPPPTRRRSASSSAQAGDRQVPRHPRRRRRHLPPDPARERLRAAGRRGGGHRLPHHQPRRAGRVLPSASAPPRWPRLGPGQRAERRSARRPSRWSCKGQFKKFVGPKDLILHLIGKISAQGANFKVSSSTGETIEQDVHLRPPGALQHGGRGRRHLRHRPGRRGDGALPARGGGRDASHLDMFGPDADAAYERSIEINVSKLQPQIACPHTVDNVKPIDAGGGQEDQPDRHRLLHQRPAGRPGHRRQDPEGQEGGARARAC